MNHNEAHQREEIVDLLVNTDHIVSIKPIRMATNDRQVIEGYWVRLSNGKKYKALQMPEAFNTKLSEELPAPRFLSEHSVEDQVQ